MHECRCSLVAANGDRRRARQACGGSHAHAWRLPSSLAVNMKLAVGPLLYFWDRAFALRFYAELCDAPVDIVYWGELVCGYRRWLGCEDWLAIGQLLQDA